MLKSFTSRANSNFPGKVMARVAFEGSLPSNRARHLLPRYLGKGEHYSAYFIDRQNKGNFLSPIWHNMTSCRLEIFHLDNSDKRACFIE